MADLSAGVAGIVDMINAGNGQNTNRAQTVANIADPWNQQRGQYQDQLNAFMKNPGAQIQSDPGYQFAMSQGLEASDRAQGAMGMGNSGNRILSDSDTATRIAGQWYDRDLKDLSNLAGVNAGSPAAAANAISAGYAADDKANAAGINSITGLLTSLLGSGGALGTSAGSLLQMITGGSSGGGGFGGPGNNINGNIGGTATGGAGGMDSSNTDFSGISAGQVDNTPGGGGMDSSSTDYGSMFGGDSSGGIDNSEINFDELFGDF